MAEEKRITFLIEGEETKDGRIIEPGAITWKDGPIAVVVHGENFAMDIIGRATDLQREANGDITATVEITSTDWPKVFGGSIGLTGPMKGGRIAGGRVLGIVGHDSPDVWPWPDRPQAQS